MFLSSMVVRRREMARLERRRQAARDLEDQAAGESRYYGGDRTIHQTSTIDVVLDSDGVVVEAWFRCQQLPFVVTQPKGRQMYGDLADLPKIVGIELAD